MYEKVEFEKLVKGDRYFIKYLNCKSKSKTKFGRFYEYYGYNSQLAIFRNLSRTTNFNSYYGESEEKFHKTSFFYKIITFKQYRQKLIEKFKESALKIILKKIVNEDFEWY
uniref:Uncharacterized protein n=1 Tax=viral metagenome TaxID=1070528 RepID=A0A6C0D2S5_9ZZZZ